MKDKKHPIPKKGEYIEITARRCSGKISPLLQIGEKYIVRDLSKLKNGSQVLVVQHPKKKKEVLRINEERFDWRVVTIAEIEEYAFKKTVADDTAKMMQVFTFEEQMKISFLPLIISELAWKYAELARRESVEYRITLLKKISRSIVQLREKYISEVRKDLDYQHIKHFQEAADIFCEEYSYDFTILFYTVNGLFKKTMPDYPYDRMRSYAIISVLLIRFLDEHNKKMDILIAKKMGGAKDSIRTPIMKELCFYMEAYAGELGKFDYNDYNLKLSLRVLEKNINKIQFDLI